MRPGSVIVDLAAEAGGNAELTEPGAVVERDGVTLVGLGALMLMTRWIEPPAMREEPDASPEDQR